MMKRQAERLSKYFSIVVRLDQFEGLNGEVAKLSEAQRDSYIREYFLQNYGEGAGSLEVQRKDDKVKLRWKPARVEPEAESYHKAAILHARRKNYVEAINSWVKAISFNPDDPDYYFNLGIAFFEIKNYKESIENLKKALALCPIYYKAHVILGTVYLKVREFDRAEVHLKQTIQFYPKHALAYLNLGAVYSIVKQYDQALAMFAKVLDLTPGEVRAHFGMAKIHALRQDLDTAKEHYSKVLELDPGGPLANYARKAMVSLETTSGTPSESPAYTTTPASGMEVEELYREGYKAYLFTDYQKAITLYRHYLKSRPTDDLVWYSLGEACLRAGAVPQAVEAFAKAIQADPNKALYYKELALALSHADRETEVIKYLQKAKERGKRDSLTLALWGKALYGLKEYEDAVSMLEEAIRLNRNNLFAKYYLAMCHAALNDRQLALSYLHEIAKARANSPLKVEAEQLARQLETGRT